MCESEQYIDYKCHIWSSKRRSKSLTASYAEILLNDQTNSESSTLNTTSLTFIANINPTIISTTGNDMTVQSSNQLNLNAGDYISITATNNDIDFAAGGNIGLDSSGNVKIGDYNASGNEQYISISNVSKNIELIATNGLKIRKSTIQYPVTFISASQSLTTESSYVQTFSGSGTALTVTLPHVTTANIGIQFLITNTDSISLTVNSSSGQSIYSSTLPNQSATRTLPYCASQIFTAIKTTLTGNVCGWSMV
jgi:hypothetical protein